VELRDPAGALVAGTTITVGSGSGGSAT
jgi:hypothetical protein